MLQGSEYYIGKFKIDIIPDAFLIEVSFIDTPPRQDRVTDLPPWTFSSRNAIWFFQEDRPYYARAKAGESVKRELYSQLHCC